MEKNTKKCLIIDVAYPGDNNLILKRNEKLDNSSELQFILLAQKLAQKEYRRSHNNIASSLEILWEIKPDKK